MVFFHDENLDLAQKIVSGLSKQDGFLYTFSPTVGAAHLQEFTAGHHKDIGKGYPELAFELQKINTLFSPQDIVLVIDSHLPDADKTPGTLAEVLETRKSNVVSLLKEHGINPTVFDHNGSGGAMVVIHSNESGLAFKLGSLLSEKAQVSPVIAAAKEVIDAMDRVVASFGGSSREDNITALQMLAQKTAAIIKESPLRAEVKAKIAAESEPDAKPTERTGGAGGLGGRR
jgi:hypothetical protein